MYFQYKASMNKIIIFLLLITTTFSASASSGNEVGNGGDVLVCPDRIQLFDFFEFQGQHGDSIEERTGDYKEIAKEVIKQLQKHDVAFAKLLERRLETFMDNAHLVSDAKLVNIKDTQSLVRKIGKDCTVEQVAILKKKVLATEKKFLINKEFWEKLSETHKAGLVIHELIYEYFADLGEKNSVNARGLNSYLFSNNFSKVSTEEYWKMIRSMKVPHYR